jgi:hypothetical protein
MTHHHQPPPGGRTLYCPCAASWAAVYGSRPVLDAAARIVARFGIDRIPCLSCGGYVAAVASSPEAER